MVLDGAVLKVIQPLQHLAWTADWRMGVSILWVFELHSLHNIDINEVWSPDY